MDKKHPEQLDGEIYLGNFDLNYYKKIGWKTKRHGINSYRKNGVLIQSSDLVPVFVQRAEIQEAYDDGPSYIKSTLESLLN